MTEFVDRWTELGPVVWLVAAASLGVWLLVLFVTARVLDPRKVAPGPATLDLQGDECPAVVNLIASDWSLGREAVPATLLDLAGRRWVTIERLGDRTTVQLAGRAPRESQLADHERKVLEHVGRLAAQTADGRVPAEALSLGPADDSRHWWRSFRGSVIDQARERGLSRARWPASAIAGIVAAGALVVLAFAAAGSTAEDDESTSDDERGGAMFGAAFVSFLGLTAIGGAVMHGERDTAEGRATAARWLGLRELLAEDPLFAEQPAAGVAIWDRHVAYGAALGVSHGAVRDLPMGAESARVAWSPVGGRWRVVRVAYRRPWPPYNGRAPIGIVKVGVLVAGLGALGLWGVPALKRAIPPPLPDWWADAEPIAMAVATGLAGLGAAALVAVLVDRVTPPLVVEGRVLRMRRRTQWTKGGENKAAPPYWHIAVDDGTRDRIRAHRTDRNFGVSQGRTVRLTASRLFRYVREIEPLPDRPATTPATASPGAAGSPAGAPAGLPPHAVALTAAVWAAATDDAQAAHGDDDASTPVSAAAVAATPTAAGASTPDGAPAARPLGGPPPPAPGGGAPGPAGPAAAGHDDGTVGDGPPTLPDSAAVSAAIGRHVVLDATARAHPLAVDGASAAYAGDGGVRVQLTWARADAVGAALPAVMREDVPSLGAGAVRSRLGRGLAVPHGAHELLVAVHLPGASTEERDRAAEAVAHATLAHPAPVRPG